MQSHRRGRSFKSLWGLILLALLYGAWLYSRPTLTDAGKLQGAIGVLLGLYICSHPAANAIDLLFFERYALSQMSSDQSGIAWLALNVLTLFAGWLIIVMGAIRLTGRVS